MKVYICGKIGEEVLSSETREKFARAEKMLRSNGYDVFNPTTSGFGESAELAAVRYGTSFYKEIIIYDLAALKQCDAIYMLSDWEKSPGANVEYDYAVATGIKRLWENKADATVFWDDEETVSEVWLPIKD